MKKSIPILAVIFGCCTAAWAAGPAPLASLRAIHALTNQKASLGLPVAFDATVSFFLPSERTLFVQDGDVAIYVSPPADVSFVPGDRVRITGTTRADFSPSVIGKSITLLRHGALPIPTKATFDELIRGQHDCILVTTRAVIRTVDVQMRNDTRDSTVPMHPVARVQLLADGGYVEALVGGSDPGTLSDLLDAEVDVTGIASFNFDGKMQPTAVNLNVTSPASFRPVALATASPWSLPATPMDRVLGGYHVRDLTQRVRVHGTITYYQPGSTVVMQDGAKSLWISTMFRGALRIGDIADAIGFPDNHNGHLALVHAEVKDSNVWAPIPANPITVKKLMASQNLFDLVSVEGQVATSVREAAQDEYVLVSDGQLFTAIYRHPELATPPMKLIPPGARVRAVGICTQEESSRFIAQRPIEILIRTPDDISIVANPSVVSTRNLLLLVGLLLAVLFAVGARGWLADRKARRHTAAMAYIEQRRSRILEDINSSRPLAAILEEITELASHKLQGAPCWCETAEGSQLGSRPPRLTGFRVVEAEIPARSGPPLGSLFAALDPRAKPTAAESKALSKTTALAELAIETRRLYSDLRHRSDFDLLTDTLNRFSLDRRIYDLIAAAGKSDAIIGLIYVDLDNFKQVNDSHGHHIGDLYLQEVSLRMKRQLRAVDSLARLGGDEFAVLVPDVHSRNDIEEIALRLEQSFDEPFSVGDVTLHNSASVGIAVYPQDASNKEGLFRIADTAMYAAKNHKRRIEIAFAAEQKSEPSRTGRS